jgi:Zn-dependent protease with chaperone function
MFRSRAYRLDNEQLILLSSIFLVGIVIILSSTVTFCVSGLLIIGMFILSAILIKSHHQSLMQHTFAVTPADSPQLSKLISECSAKLQPGPVEVFLARQNQINAYTFGISSPKVLVLYTPLLDVMDRDELSFIIGHEMGHVALGHTWLNTIVGGLAGVPSSFGASILIYSTFLWWNRVCEYSADRAGLLACGDLNKAVSALVKLVAPGIRNTTEYRQALTLIDAEDDQVGSHLSEIFQTHPMLIKRVNKLRAYARSNEYQRLQAGVNSNLKSAGAKTPSPPPPTQNQKPEPSPKEKWPWLKS